MLPLALKLSYMQQAVLCADSENTAALGQKTVSETDGSQFDDRE